MTTLPGRARDMPFGTRRYLRWRSVCRPCLQRDTQTSIMVLKYIYLHTYIYMVFTIFFFDRGRWLDGGGRSSYRMSGILRGGGRGVTGWGWGLTPLCHPYPLGCMFVQKKDSNLPVSIYTFCLHPTCLSHNFLWRAPYCPISFLQTCPHSSLNCITALNIGLNTPPDLRNTEYNILS